MDSSIENITQREDIYNEINKPDKISQPFLSKYEKTKIIGLAAQQIESGREPSIPIPSSLVEPIDIAEFELKNKKTPFIIKRKLPNNTFEYWTLDQLHIF